MKKPFAIIVQWPYWYGQNEGLALAPFVFVKDKEDQVVVNHELIHIRQQYDHWIIWFHIRYLYQLYTKGYMNIDYEIEAYEKQNTIEFD